MCEKRNNLTSPPSAFRLPPSAFTLTEILIVVAVLAGGFVLAAGGIDLRQLVGIEVAVVAQRAVVQGRVHARGPVAAADQRALGPASQCPRVKR